MSKSRVSSTDTQRTMRAYEVKAFTKKSLYEWASNTKSDFLDFDIKKIFIDIPREELLINISTKNKLNVKKNVFKRSKNF